MRKKLTILFAIALFCSSASLVRAEDPLLKIQAIPDQTTVKIGMMFLVSAQVTNVSSDTSTGFWTNTCSYEKHWVTDTPGVFIQSWTCDKNALEETTLEPGDVYQKNIILYFSEQEKTGPATVRLGFKRMSEDGDVAEPLWGEPFTIHVIVPEEVKSVPPAVAADLQAADQGTETSAALAEVPEDAELALMSAADQPLMFQDPGIPIQVSPGDEFSIELVSNPSTGFHWQMTLPEDDEIVTFLSSEHVVSQEGMMGAPGTEVFKFKAVTPGGTNASFVYKRSWETITAPTRKIFTILVQEN